VDSDRDSRGVVRGSRDSRVGGVIGLGMGGVDVVWESEKNVP